MVWDEQQKNSLATSFQSIVRQSQVKVDVQRLTVAFRMVIDQLEPDQPIELQSLSDYLVHDQGLPERNAVELCVILKSREDKLGVVFTPTATMSVLGAEAVEHILAGFNQRVDRSNSWEAKALSPERPAEAAGWVPPKRASARPLRTRLLAAGVAATVAVAVGFFLWRSATHVPPMATKGGMNDPSGLPCVELLFDGTTAICTLGIATYGAEAPESLAAKADLTASSVRAHGGKTLYVRTIEDNRIVIRK